jgi:hypothetical protein
VAARTKASAARKEPDSTKEKPGEFNLQAAVAQVGTIVENVFGTKLRDEARQVPDSPEELITFFSQHIGGVGMNRHSESHVQACEGALTKLRAFSLNDPRLRRVVGELQAQYDAAKAAQKRLLFAVLGFTIAFFFVLMSFAGYMAVNETNRRSEAREEVQKLVRQGRYPEARVRAQGLETKNDIEQMLQVIDKAEKGSAVGSR